MTRPKFTRNEEALIARTLLDVSTPSRTILLWSPWLAISAGSFLYGFLADNPACVFVGFTLAYYVICYFIYYQAKPTWSMKPVIEKYEAACADSGEISPNSGSSPESNTA